ncbi:MAG: YgiT-type zinc finger protein [Chloroflexaceae bacterium]|nr:YgiT-type zinc finger protein [Chloroflexaceae bacterium]
MLSLFSITYEAQLKSSSEIFKVQEKFYLVENIPATVCSRCREEVFSREATERIRAMLQEKPIRSIQLDVFAFNQP